MKTKYILPRIGAILFIIIALASCEEDFSNIQTDIIDQNFNTELDDSRTVIAYSKKYHRFNLIGYRYINWECITIRCMEKPPPIY